MRRGVNGRTGFPSLRKLATDAAFDDASVRHSANMACEPLPPAYAGSLKFTGTATHAHAWGYMLSPVSQASAELR